LLGSNYHKIISVAAGALPQTMLGKLTSGPFLGGREGRKRKKEREGRNDEKGLQCREFKTLVGNPTCDACIEHDVVCLLTG